MPFDIHPEIERARTPPPALYRDPAYFERARDRIFVPSWQLVGDAARLRAPGQVVPIQLLPGCLDEPLLLTRDHDDRLHCLSNVCTHRGMQVAESEEVCRVLRCRYHGRRFRLDGSFVSMPEFQGVESFPAPEDDLPAVALESFGPWLFASLAPAVPFAEWIAPVAERLDGRVPWLLRGGPTFEPGRSRDYLVRANWALYCENYLEGFHIPYVHAGLAETLDYDGYRTELFAGGNVQIGAARGAEDAFDPDPEASDAGERIAAYYFWLFPNTMLNVYPWGVSVNVVQPLAADRTRVSFLTFVADPARLESGAGAALDRVEREDEVIVERVQANTASRLYRRGRYSPARERGVHQFHRMLAAALGDPE